MWNVIIFHHTNESAQELINNPVVITFNIGEFYKRIVEPYQFSFMSDNLTTTLCKINSAFMTLSQILVEELHKLLIFLTWIKIQYRIF